MKRIIAVFLMMSVIILTLPVFSLKASASAGSFDDAIEVSLGECVEVILEASTSNVRNASYYKIHTSSAEKYSMCSIYTGYSSGINITVLDESHNRVAGSNLRVFDPGRRGKLNLKPDSTYYIVVEDGLLGNRGIISCIFRIQEGDPKDNVINLGIDGKTIASAIPIEIGEEVNYASAFEGEMTPNYCWYKFNSSENLASVYMENIISGEYTGFYYYNEFGGRCKTDSVIDRETAFCANTTYYLLVWGKIEKYDGTFRIEEQICTAKPQTPKNFRVSPNKVSVVVRWDRMKEISGYQIAYKKTTDRKWKYVNVSATENVKGIYPLTKNTSYTFMVRVKRVVQGNTYWSAWTASKTVRTRR